MHKFQRGWKGVSCYLIWTYKRLKINNWRLTSSALSFLFCSMYHVDKPVDSNGFKVWPECVSVKAGGLQWCDAYIKHSFIIPINFYY